jgi:hypothetical protein
MKVRYINALRAVSATCGGEMRYPVPGTHEPTVFKCVRDRTAVTRAAVARRTSPRHLGDRVARYRRARGAGAHRSNSVFSLRLTTLSARLPCGGVRHTRPLLSPQCLHNAACAAQAASSTRRRPQPHLVNSTSTSTNTRSTRHAAPHASSAPLCRRIVLGRCRRESIRSLQYGWRCGHGRRWGGMRRGSGCA